MKKIDKLEKEIQELTTGHKGACHCCEPVGELNKKLQEELEEVKEHLEIEIVVNQQLDEKILELEQKTSDLQISLTSSLEYCNIKDKKILELEEMVSNLQKSLTSNLQDQYEDYKSEEE